MNTSLSRVNNLFRTYWREIAVFLLFFLVAVVAVAYSTTLPFTIHGDTYVTLLANKVVVDPTYPDRQFLLNFDFKPYLYTNLLSFLVKYFSLFTYKLILLFFLVLGTCYFSYIAFRMLGFSRSISIIVALVALMPRNAITGGGFGVFIADGQCFWYWDCVHMCILSV